MRVRVGREGQTLIPKVYLSKKQRGGIITRGRGVRQVSLFFVARNSWLVDRERKVEPLLSMS